jgi:hypothetical protein
MLCNQAIGIGSTLFRDLNDLRGILINRAFIYRGEETARKRLSWSPIANALNGGSNAEEFIPFIGAPHQQSLRRFALEHSLRRD